MKHNRHYLVLYALSTALKDQEVKVQYTLLAVYGLPRSCAQDSNCSKRHRFSVRVLFGGEEKEGI